jgi:hypothetical protein
MYGGARRSRLVLREHQQLPADRTRIRGVLMVALRRQDVRLRDADLMAAHRAPIDAGVRRGNARSVGDGEGCVLSLMDVVCVLIESQDGSFRK